MSYLVLARKWRPQVFEDVIGQEHVTRTLKNALESNRLAHALLFSGAKGVGKTTTARILAKAINCQQGINPEPCGQCFTCDEITTGSSIDVIEIDGASNTGVDDIRELREAIRYVPSRSRYKVYIIDEVHMLSNSAFNALLKTLEEPPPHALFIFATTEPRKIPATILSRCQHFEFRKISQQAIIERLRYICAEEGISITEKGLRLIALASEGSLRDSLSLLDQSLAYCGMRIKEEDLSVILALPDNALLCSLSMAIAERNAEKALQTVDDAVERGYDLRRLIRDIAEHFRNILITKITSKPERLLDMPEEDIKQIIKIADAFSIEDVELLLNHFLRAEGEIRATVYPRFLLELYLVEATRFKEISSINEIIERLAHAEKNLPIDSVSTVSITSEEIENKNELGNNRNFSVLWGKIVKKIKEKKAPLGSKLEQAEFMGFDGKELKIGFNGGLSFLVDSVNHADNKKIITDAAKELTGFEIGIRAVAINRTAEPFIKSVLEIFEGRLIDVKPKEKMGEE
ncbi:MAG: DNA polymerase III subunit gamma/tau [Nitrospirota bacterium]